MAKSIYGDEKPNELNGRFLDELIVGKDGNDTLRGNYDTFRDENTSTEYKPKDIDIDGGHDILFGGTYFLSSQETQEQIEGQEFLNLFSSGDINKIPKSPLNSNSLPTKDYFVAESSNDGQDVLNVGLEDHPPDFSGAVDDFAVGGSNTDYLFGIGRSDNDYFGNTNLDANLEGWIDDNKKFERFRGDVFKGIANGAGKDLEGDVLLGGSGVDLYVVGTFDTVVEKNPEKELIYKSLGSSGKFGTNVNLVNPNWSGIYSHTLGARVYYNGGGDVRRSDGFPTEISQGDFTTGNEIVTFTAVGEGERSRFSSTVQFPGIIKNENGDIAFRFFEGTVILSEGDPTKPIFIKANEYGKLKDGDFGFNFPELAGFESNTDEYYIGGSQWLTDLETSVEAQIPGIGTSVASEAQEWLRATIYPLVDPYYKALINDRSYDEYYEIVDVSTGQTFADGELTIVRYDDDGRESLEIQPVDPSSPRLLSPTLVSDQVAYNDVLADGQSLGAEALASDVTFPDLTQQNGNGDVLRTAEQDNDNLLTFLGEDSADFS